MNFDNPYAVDSKGNRLKELFNIIQSGKITKIDFTPAKSEKIKEVVLYSDAHKFDANAAFYGDGYQKLSQYSGTVSNIKTITGYTDWGHYKMPVKSNYTTVYNYALIGAGENVVLIGATSGKRFRLEIRVNSKAMEIAQILEDLEYKGGEKIA